MVITIFIGYFAFAQESEIKKFLDGDGEKKVIIYYTPFEIIRNKPMNEVDFRQKHLITVEFQGLIVVSKANYWLYLDSIKEKKQYEDLFLLVDFIYDNKKVYTIKLNDPELSDKKRIIAELLKVY